MTFDQLAAGATALELLRSHAGGNREVANFEVAPGARIGVELKRAELASQVTGAPGEADHAGNRHVRRHVLARAEMLRHHRSHLRIVDDRGRRVAGKEMIGCLPVVGNLAYHRAHDRQLVGHLGRAGEVFAEHLAGVGLGDIEGAAIFGRRFGLGIPRFLLSHAAGQMYLNDARGFGLGLARRFSHCTLAEEVSERQP